MRSWRVGATLALAALLVNCGGGNTAPIGITIFPTTATVVLTAQQPFTATVTGSSNTSVTWSVNPSTAGTITTAGVYTAPATLPSPPTATVTATAQANTKISASATVTITTGISVQVSPLTATVGTGETFQFTAQVSPTNTPVNWSVNNIAGGNPTFGTISAIGLYTAPATAPSPSNVTITATSAADMSKKASATVTVLTATDPMLTSIDPNTAAQGSVFQDVYLNAPPGTNTFFSTSTVKVNGAADPTTFTAVPTTFISTTLLRARICAAVNAAVGCTLAPPPLPSTAMLKVVAQNGHSSGTQPLTVMPVRPALIAASPDSAALNGSATVNLDGGFYSSATGAQFNGQPVLPGNLHVANTRQLSVVLSSSDLATAGLFPLEMQNAGVAGIAGVNLAIEPTGVATAPKNVPVGAAPAAVAINTATETAVVANQGDNSISLIDLSADALIGNAIAVGKTPTGVDVDNILNKAVVVNSGDNTLSIVNLADKTVSTLSLSGFTPSGSMPFSVGVNPLTHRVLVANTSTNTATIVTLDLNDASACTPAGTHPPCVVGTVTSTLTVQLGTGPTPAIAIEPRLNWGIISPGGSGAVTIVDLGRPASPGDIGRPPELVAAFNNSASTRGIAINTETEQALLTDPNDSLGNVTLFSVLDQLPTRFAIGSGQVAAAVNPLTNIGVVVNNSANAATVVNLRTQLQVISPITVGTAPIAVAIDPASNQAVVANQGSNNVSILFLGSIRPLHLTQVSPATTLAVSPTTCASAPSLPVTLTGNGFSGSAPSSIVRLDQTALPAADVVFNSPRELVANVPACMLAAPRRYTLDVLNPGPPVSVSNETDLTVMQAVSVGASPVAVALDTDRELAVVTNSTDGTVSIVNLPTATTAASVAATITVGTSPQGVAVLPRLGRAIVTNNGSNNASIVDLVGHTSVLVGTGAGPLGVAIQPDTARAVIANTLSNSVTIVGVDTGQAVANVGVDLRPESVAIDLVDNLAAVVCSTQRTLVLVNLATDSLALPPRLSGVLQSPKSVAFDPVTDMFLVADGGENVLAVVDPLKLTFTTPRVGLNPTSLDYNFQTGTVVTVNNASNTLSVMDLQAQQVRAVLPLAGSTSSSVAIDPKSNIAVLVDQANNRILLVPLPR